MDVTGRHSEVVKRAVILDREYSAVTSSGGPSSYYDIPLGIVTLNDLLEWLAINRWGPYSIHMKDLFKGGFRFGAKSGTSLEYDANKLIYSGCRLLAMIAGKQRVVAYLRDLINDPQFNEEGRE